MTRILPAALAPWVLFAIACDAQTDTERGLTAQEHEAAQLERALTALLQPPAVGGCGDIHVYAGSTSDRHAMLLDVSGATIEEAYAGGALELEFVLPHPDIHLVVQWGTDLTINECDDVMMGTPVVNGEAAAVEGVVLIDLELLLAKPLPWDMSSQATIRMEDVVFETASGAQRTWSIDLGSTSVGWLPG